MININVEKLNELIEQRYIGIQKHPTLSLYIYNYTQRCQFDRMWTQESMACRGLILNVDTRVSKELTVENIIARPFPKFFNLGEILGRGEQIPAEDFVVTEKMDGCLPYSTPLNLWEGGTVPIGEVVSKRLSPILIGCSDLGEIVPVQPINWFDNGTKDNWLEIKVDCLPSYKSGARTGNKLRITSNHQVATDRGWIPAGQLSTDDSMVNYERVPDGNALHVIRSGLLGDGSISPTGNAFKYSEGHTSGQSSLSLAVRKWLGSAGGNRSNTVSGYASEIVWAVSKTLKSLKSLREEWYPEGIKVLPKDLSWVDDFSIAKWYMDDGSLSHTDSQQDRAQFSSHGFSLDDNNRLALLLTQRYGVDARVQPTPKGFYIRVNSGRNFEIYKFWSGIAPYIIPELRYKLPADYRNYPYVDQPVGSLLNIPSRTRVLSVKSLKNDKKTFPSGRKGFDIQTKTGNFYAKGVLVHNSLGVLYCDADGRYSLATRGSFVSDQARKGTAMLRDQYAGTQVALNDYPDMTFLFEIIYPENRIVVDYGGKEQLVLIAAISTKSGHEWYYEQLRGFAEMAEIPVVTKYDGITDFEKIEARPNSEGYVVHFPSSGQRFKVKFDEYVRLHKLITGVNKKTIWELLMNNHPVTELLDRVPDEFYKWVGDTIDELRMRYAAIELSAQNQFEELTPYYGNRKEFAIRATKMTYPSILFNMLDKKAYDQVIWKMIRPVAELPFKEDIDG